MKGKGKDFTQINTQSGNFTADVVKARERIDTCLLVTEDAVVKKRLNAYDIVAKSITTDSLNLTNINKGSVLVSDGTNFKEFPIAGNDLLLISDNTTPQGLRWATTVPGSGDVDGPIAGATDNALTRFDGTTGKLIQNSVSTLDDAGLLTTTAINVSGSASQDILVHDGTSFASKNVGTNGQILGITAGNVDWVTPTYGDVVGPTSATDNALTRFDGTTGKLIQNSSATLDDTGVLTTEEVNVNKLIVNGPLNLPLLNPSETVSTDAVGNLVSVSPLLNWQTGADAVGLVRIGSSASTTTTNQVAILGYAFGVECVAISKASAVGDYSIGIGSNTLAQGYTSIAIGGNPGTVGAASAIGLASISIGTYSDANNTNALAIGSATTARGDSSSAIGFGASTGAFANALAIGTRANANNNGAISFGTDSIAQGEFSISVGRESNAIGTNSIAVGGSFYTGARATANNAIAIGDSTVASGNNSVAIGNGSLAANVGVIMIGKAKTTAPAGTYSAGYGIYIGNEIEATSPNAYQIMIGSEVKCSSGGSGAIAIGRQSEVAESYPIAIGYSSLCIANSAIAMGYSAKVTTAVAYNAMAIGTQSTASGLNSMAIGYDSTATAEKSLALGNNADATVIRAIAIGTDSGAAGDGAIGLGFFARASGSNSNAFGSLATATGTNTLAVGSEASATHSNASSFGFDATSQQTESVNFRHNRVHNEIFTTPNATPVAKTIYNIPLASIGGATGIIHATAWSTATPANHKIMQITNVAIFQDGTTLTLGSAPRDILLSGGASAGWDISLSVTTTNLVLTVTGDATITNWDITSEFYCI